MVTPEFYFYLKDINSNVPSLIYLQSRFNGERLMLTTGEKILPAHWDFKRKRANVTKNRLEYPAINDWLNKIELAARDYFRSCRYDGIEPAAQIIKEHLEKTFKLNQHLYKVEKPKKVYDTLLKFIDKFIEEEKGNKAEATIKVYKTSKNHLTNYFTLHGKSDIPFNDIDATFYSTYIQYLNGLNLAKNSVGKQIKVLKTFLNAASDQGLNSNQIHKSKIFKKPTEEVDKVYLTDDEIQRIYKLNLNDNKDLEVTRDLFIIACYTGFRFSDFTSLKREHIGEEFITKMTLKTKARVIIPIHPIVREILLKYNNELPEGYSNQHVNRQLKEIVEAAEITSDVEIIKTIGGRSVRNVFKKFELVSTHTGRRSFATNAYLAGVPTISIMFITGHSTESAFMSYICIDELKNAQHIQNHQFFNKKCFLNVAEAAGKRI
jgi:integrase